MYRIVNFGSSRVAVELLTSGRDIDDEWEEIETFVAEGNKVTITDELEDGVDLVERDWQ